MRQTRVIVIRGDVAVIPLTKDYEAIIDSSDFDLVNGYNWTAQVNRNNVYAYRSERISGRSNTMLLHRILMQPEDGMVVDHINGNTLDNRRANLRVCTASQNSQNSRLSKSNTTGLKGVTFRKDRNKFQAQIIVQRKKKHLGYFDTPEEAHAEYLVASRAMHGDYGYYERIMRSPF